MASLFMIRGRDAGKHFSIQQERLVLGRDAACDLPIVDHEVSRQHAMIVLENQQCKLVDLKSSNGSFVNGQRVVDCLLRSGDRIQIGRTLLVYTSKDSEILVDRPVDVDIVIDPSTDRSDSNELSQIRHSLPSFDAQRSDVPSLGSEIKMPRSIEASVPPTDPITKQLPDTIDRSHWEIMYRTVLAVSRTMDIDQLLQQILELIFQWVACDRGCIMLTSEDSQELHPVARRNRSASGSSHRIEISKTILDYVAQRREGVLTSNAGDDQRWQPGASIAGMGIREAICVPMQGRYGMVGAIYIDTSQSAGRFAESRGQLTFHEEHLKLMIAIGHQAALAVEDSFYYRGMVQAERLATMGQTIATLSHHIKNILQGIRGGSYLIEEGLKRQQIETIGRGWKIVDKNQDRIESLVMDMLTYSKDRQPQLARVDLREIADDCIELVQGQASDHAIQVVWDRPEEAVMVMAEAEAIHRAILNVLQNAIDALSETAEGRIAISIVRSERHSSLDIADNGPGIAADDLQRIFSLFESSKGSRGTGLGLPVSQKILREHQGDIEVTSQLGQGARFRLILPAITAEPPLPDPPTDG